MRTCLRFRVSQATVEQDALLDAQMEQVADKMRLIAPLLAMLMQHVSQSAPPPCVCLPYTCLTHSRAHGRTCSAACDT